MLPFQGRKERLFAFGMEALSAAAVALRASEGKGKVSLIVNVQSLRVLERRSRSKPQSPDRHFSHQLYVHSFSNGGLMVWECIEIAMAGNSESAFQRRLSGEDEDVLALVKSSLAGHIFDSCPCYLWLSTGFRAIGTAVPGLVPRYLLQASFVL